MPLPGMGPELPLFRQCSCDLVKYTHWSELHEIRILRAEPALLAK